MDKISRRRGRVGKKSSIHSTLLQLIIFILYQKGKEEAKVFAYLSDTANTFSISVAKKWMQIAKVLPFLRQEMGNWKYLTHTIERSSTHPNVHLFKYRRSSSHVLNYIFEVYQALDASRRKVMSKVARNCITPRKRPKRQRNDRVQKGNVYSSLEIETNYLFLGESLLKRLKIKTFSVLLGSSHLLGQCYSTQIVPFNIFQSESCDFPSSFTFYFKQLQKSILENLYFTT